ncbi:MAG: DUF3160 domain-containing protein [Syntrophomonadaceae bacterium]
MRNKGLLTLVLMLTLVILFGLTLGSCKNKKTVTGETPSKLTLTASAADFGHYQEHPVNIKPCVPPYQVAPDLSNIANRNRFEFSPDAQALLVKNGFVIIPGNGLEFFGLYEPNRYDKVPNFVTTDAMLHNYHLFFTHLLKTVEQEKLIPSLKQLNACLLSQSTQVYQQLKGSPWENAARRNLAFFAVGSRLMDPSVATPYEVQAVVEQELALINAHQGWAVSPVMNMSANQNELENLKEDYTQYIPRSHYASSPEMQNYFKSMMWYGRLTFRLKDVDETRSAALITVMLNDNNTLPRWVEIYLPTSFFVGKSDDLGYYQYIDVLQSIYGKDLTISQLTSDAAKWQQFQEQSQQLQPPAINSIPIFDANLQPDREKEIKGFRFMGQRFTLDASIFQRLIYREVGENQQGERRMLPKGLDIPAAMGSAEAYQLLEGMGATGYQKYPENMKKLQNYIMGLNSDVWTQNLYWTWLYTIKPLTEPKGEGYPSFMQNQAWTRKELSTYLASWTELKHDTILYAKQSYAEAGGGPEMSDDRGYVEPNPYLYGRLASLTALTRDGLASRGLLNDRDKESLNRMETLSLSLKSISEKELTNQPLSKEEYDLIRSFGAQLEHFWLEALTNPIEGRLDLWDHPSALVADVSSAPGTVLEEATGFVSDIYAVVPVEGSLRIARGAVFSYYEFAWPADQRLTDQAWVDMLRGNAPPQAPEWTGSFKGSGPVQIYE